MKKLYMALENFYLGNTKKVLENSSTTRILRKNVGVFQIRNRYFELEEMKDKRLILPKPLPVSSTVEEYVDKNSLHKFPYSENFDFKNATLESLRSEYRKFLFKMEDTMMQTEKIQNLYIGSILKCNYQSIRFLNTERYLENVLLLKLENGKFMTLEDFLNGKNLFYLSKQQEGKYFVYLNSLKEQSLEEVKKLQLIKNNQ